MLLMCVSPPTGTSTELCGSRTSRPATDQHRGISLLLCRSCELDSTTLQAAVRLYPAFPPCGYRALAAHDTGCCQGGGGAAQWGKSIHNSLTGQRSTQIPWWAPSRTIGRCGLCSNTESCLKRVKFTPYRSYQFIPETGSTVILCFHSCLYSLDKWFSARKVWHKTAV